MNRAAILVGIVAIVGAALLLLLEKSTPENERVLVKPFYTQSHEWVRIQINLLLLMGAVFITAGLIL